MLSPFFSGHRNPCGPFLMVSDEGRNIDAAGGPA
jgi:hypothetical protein